MATIPSSRTIGVISYGIYHVEVIKTTSALVPDSLARLLVEEANDCWLPDTNLVNYIQLGILYHGHQVQTIADFLITLAHPSRRDPLAHLSDELPRWHYQFTETDFIDWELQPETSHRSQLIPRMELRVMHQVSQDAYEPCSFSTPLSVPRYG